LQTQALGRFVLESPLATPLLDGTSRLLFRKSFRRPLFSLVDLALRHGLRRRRAAAAPAAGRIASERLLVARAVLGTVERLISTGGLSPHVMRTITEGWGRAWCLSGRHSPAGRRFRSEHRSDPPWFLAVAPTGACNLSCPGCYADAGGVPEHLPWKVLRWVMSEARRDWEVPLFVFSGANRCSTGPRGTIFWTSWSSIRTASS